MSLNRLFILFLAIIPSAIRAQRVDYSVVYVPEESGLDLMCVTSANDYVCMPIVQRAGSNISWLSNRILDISHTGTHIAYLSMRNNTTNIFIKDLSRQGSSVQRTNRQAVLDFSYSPDGKNICFSETRGKINQIFVTDALQGYVCRQITNAAQDYSPSYSSDMSEIFFSRLEANGSSVWGHNVKSNFLASYSTGMNPCPIKGEKAFLCVRNNSEGRTEIWKIHYDTGIEECIVSSPEHSYTSPTVSPDGNWILFVGDSSVDTGNGYYKNTDIYVCRMDGTGFAQLTYHAVDDLSPVWSSDGQYIYFISQRGSAEATANVWRMKFAY